MNSYVMYMIYKISIYKSTYGRTSTSGYDGANATRNALPTLNK